MQAAFLTSTHKVQQPSRAAVTAHKSGAFIFVFRFDSTICIIAVLMSEQRSFPLSQDQET